MSMFSIFFSNKISLYSTNENVRIKKQYIPIVSFAINYKMIFSFKRKIFDYPLKMHSITKGRLIKLTVIYS